MRTVEGHTHSTGRSGTGSETTASAVLLHHDHSAAAVHGAHPVSVADNHRLLRAADAAPMVIRFDDRDSLRMIMAGAEARVGAGGHDDHLGVVAATRVHHGGGCEFDVQASLW